MIQRFFLKGLMAAVASAVLVGCTTSPPAPPPEPTVPEEVPEITLNLPKQDCLCSQPVAEQDYTFLERGYQALAAGNYIESVQYFQSYQRLEKSREASWEADIAIAYVSMLPSSPFFDANAARKSFRKLEKQLSEDMQLHPNARLMRESLEAFVVMDRHIADLENNNATLKEDLEKREAALKRLRELTLGQKGSRQ